MFIGYDVYLYRESHHRCQYCKYFKDVWARCLAKDKKIHYPYMIRPFCSLHKTRRGDRRNDY